MIGDVKVRDGDKSSTCFANTATLVNAFQKTDGFNPDKSWTPVEEHEYKGLAGRARRKNINQTVTPSICKPKPATSEGVASSAHTMNPAPKAPAWYLLSRHWLSLAYNDFTRRAVARLG